tara:strand:+ start:126 stop:524 length:399 start_codon:yes stop_codon:yes gene_type:complete
MIRYKLRCRNCDNSFDSWFASSKEYDKLRKLKHLNCHYCNSIKIEKTLMAPSIVNPKKQNISILKNKKINKLKIKLKNIKNLLKRILTTLETIFRMKQDLCIIITKKNQKVFMEKQLSTKFQNLKMKELILM